MSAPLPEPVHLGVELPIFGFLHDAEAGADRSGTAVLLCPPFGWEEVCSYRSRREWATHLAEGGRPSLRFDLPGTGDSAGTSSDPELLEAWIGAVGEAATWLRATSGCERLVAIGIGLGGMLALGSSAADAPIDDLILWGAPARGRALVRELRAFALLNPSESNGVGEALPSSLPEGAIETGGFLMSTETAAALGSLDLTKLSLPDAAGRRIMLLGRDELQPDARLLAHLESAGADVCVAGGTGYASMMAHPQQATAPREVFAIVDAWLEAGSQREGEGETGRAAPRSHGRAGIELAAAGIHETPRTFELTAGRVFGILAEPTEPSDRRELCAVLVNAGALRRIGPGRMWVELARRWAAAGTPTLRLDIEGIGDADGDATRYADVAELYVPRLTEQVTAVLDALSESDVPQRFLLCGLCSGAYWSFHAALRDERVRAAYLLNPRALFWDDSLESAREASKTRNLAKASSWRRLLSGEVDAARVREHARHSATALRRLPARAIASRTRRSELEDAFDRLREREQSVRLLFGENEPLRDELEREGRFKQLTRWPNLEVEFLPGPNHTFEPIGSQGPVHEILDGWLERELEAVAAPAR